VFLQFFNRSIIVPRKTETAALYQFAMQWTTESTETAPPAAQRYWLLRRVNVDYYSYSVRYTKGGA
jgi:hypothetical protein